MRKRSSSSSRLRLTAVVITLAAAALMTVLVACPPSQKRAIAQTPPPGMAAGGEKPREQPPELAQEQPRETAQAVVPTSPPQRTEPQGKLAVILDDAGYSLQELQPFLDLPIPLTVAVLPNLPHSSEAARRVLAAGKDLILHCPMEADGGENPGPGALRVGMSEEEIDRLLDAAFLSVPGAQGMNNHMGSRATADPALMEAVLSYVKRRGLFFVDSRTTAQTVGPSIALRLGVPFLQRNLFIDDERSEKAVADAFTAGIKEARDRGTAIVIGHVQNKSVLDILDAGRKEMAGSGVHLARLEEIMSETRVAQQGRGHSGACVF